MTRQETNCRVERASGQAKQGVVPFCRIAATVAAVGRRDNCSCNWAKRRAAKGNEDRFEYGISIFHKLNVLCCTGFPLYKGIPERVLHEILISLLALALP